MPIKRIWLTIIATLVFLAGFITANAQTVDEIIQKHLTAIGGAENWKKMNSIKKTCVRIQRGVEIPVNITVLQGKGYRMETTVGGMISYYIITDKEAWYFNPRNQQKPDALPAQTVQLSQNELDIQGALIDYKTKGYKINYYGTDDVEGTECHKLKVTMPSGKEETIFIDASNYYLVRITDKTKANGKEQVQTTTYGDYEKLPEGIIYPMSYNNVTIKKIEINGPVDERIFKPGELKK